MGPKDPTTGAIIVSGLSTVPVAPLQAATSLSAATPNLRSGGYET